MHRVMMKMGSTIHSLCFRQHELKKSKLTENMIKVW